MKFLKLIFATFFIIPILYQIHTSNACTRVVYQGPNGNIITARSMDWKDEIPADIWLFPRGMIRNCSVPFGIASEEEPNISSTRWRSVADQKNLVYYFETVLTPNTFWVDISNVDFSE